jgi:general secretion pathway protein I
MLMRMRKAEAGFTLIEMLVALSVFSIAALALLRLDAYAVATAADIDARIMAGIVVQNAAVLAATDPGPVVRGTSTSTMTNGGRRYALQRIVTPTADGRLVRIDLVAVEQGTTGRAVLTMVKRVQ